MASSSTPHRSLTVMCTELDRDGAGVAIHEDLRLHLTGALPGERVEARVTHVSPHQHDGFHEAWGETTRIDVRSEFRREPPCRHFGPCGGCQLQHMNQEAQLAWKHAVVASAFAAYPALAGVPVAPCRPSPDPLGYRNQAKYVCARDARGRLVLGAYRPRTHDVLDIAGCLVLEPALETIASSLRTLLDRKDVTVYDEARRTGHLRYVVLRAAATGQVLVTLVGAGPPPGWVPDVAKAVRAQSPQVVGVVHNENPAPGNVLFGTHEQVIDGEGHLYDELPDGPVSLSPRSFFQINRAMAAWAYAAIAERVRALGPVDLVVDAYGGTGGIARALAPVASRVLVIENNPSAARDAQEAARRRGHPQLNVMTADAAAGLQTLSAADVIVINPPRAGCAPGVTGQVARLGPRLVAYLSCDPETLARDLAAFAQAGLVTETAQPFDMLPQTAHIEILAFLVSPGL